MTAMPTEELIARDLAVAWHPCSQMRDYETFAPLHVVGAQGCRIRLADGRELLDAISSWWCKSLGHGHPRLQAALIAQAQRFEHVIFANTTHENIVRLCERLVALANGAPSTDAAASPHYQRVFLAGDGSVGMEIALKMALQAQRQMGRGGRTRFAYFENGYHGETIATLAVGDCGLYGDPYRPLMFDATCLRGLPYRSGPDDPRWHDAATEWPALQAQLDAIAPTLAGIVYEPVLQGAGGMRLYSPDLLPRLRAWADAHDVFLIADEIASGMGRLGAPLATHLACSQSRHPAVLPHFAVMSKGLTSGYMPLSAVLTTEAIYQTFLGDYGERKAFMHSNTYTGHALAVAVALAALDVYEEERILDHVARIGPTLRQGLTQLADTRPWLANVRGAGMVAAVDITPRNPEKPRPPHGRSLDHQRRTGYAVYQAAVRRGALLRNLGDTMYLFPPLNTPAADIELMLRILANSLDEVVAPRA